MSDRSHGLRVLDRAMQIQTQARLDGRRITDAEAIAQADDDLLHERDQRLAEDDGAYA
jgi:hypothetical protein